VFACVWPVLSRDGTAVVLHAPIRASLAEAITANGSLTRDAVRVSYTGRPGESSGLTLARDGQPLEQSVSTTGLVSDLAPTPLALRVYNYRPIAFSS
jgi:hypothetical protein